VENERGKGQFGLRRKQNEMRWILSFLLPYKKQILLILLCFFCINVTELAVPRLIGILIDRVFPRQDLQLFYRLLAAIVVAVAAMYAVIVKKNTLVRMVQELATRDLQAALFRKMRELGVPYSAKRPAGEMLGLLSTEVQNVQRIYGDFLPWLAHAVIYTALSVGVMAAINLPMAMATIPCLLIYVGFAPYFERKSTEASKRIAENRLKFGRMVYENISALREIRATGWRRGASGGFSPGFARSTRRILRRTGIPCGALRSAGCPITAREFSSLPWGSSCFGKVF
jgi:ABC-type multidrug transport system fused ATPase/permease subunit